MIIAFATKRNPNGYRKYLGIDTDNKTFSRWLSCWISREDFTEISATDRRAMIEKLEKAGFTEIEQMQF